MYSNQPEHTVYSGPQAPSPKRVTLRTLRAKYARGDPITMVTAYDYPSAVHVRNPIKTAMPLLAPCHYVMVFSRITARDG